MDSISPKISNNIFSSFQPNSFATDIEAATALPSSKVVSETSWSFFSNIPWYIWLIFVLVLAFFGFNIFLYLAVSTQYVSDLFSPIIAKITSVFGGALAETAKQTTNAAETGASAIVNSANVGSTPGQSVIQASANDGSQQTALYNTLNTTQQQEKHNDTEYHADDSHSTIQQSKSSNKAGWCYIGEDRGFRSCIKVNEGDTCMSGNIFPSKDLCVNPNLRA